MKFIDLNYKQFKTTDIARCLTARYTAAPTNHACENSGVLVGGNMEVRAVLTPDQEEKRQNGRRMKDEGEPMFTLTAQDRHGVAIIDDQGRANKKLIPSDICPTLRAQSHGNEPKVIDAIYNNREPRVSDVCPTLRSERTGLLVKEGTPLAYDEQNNTLRTDGTVGTLTTDGSSPKHNNRVIIGESGVRIRRLTPRECWRLQGFPDECFDKAKAAGISDSQLYKMAGNAVSVPVAKAIGLRLKELEDD